jgi:hypothetical protein
VDSSWCEELALAAGRLGRALGRAGYFGPFGVDGYEYRDRGGDLRLQPASDLNARYTMGWVDPR